ncbi:MAG: HD-GYP domain-containing protein [Deltaproteobacteria bacterium]|nr:HD-GYP domain-containing protein [Deltaproteobacteria bacterium]
MADLGRNWLNHPWKTNTRLLRSQEEIRELEAYGISEVIVDTNKSAYDFDEKPKQNPQSMPRPADSQTQAGQPAPPPRQTVSVSRSPEPVSGVEMELPQATKAYNRILDTSKALVAACRLNKKIDVAIVEENVQELVDSVSRNRDAMIALMKLRRFDDYSYTHSLNVSVLAISAGKCLGLGDDDLRNLGLGTMFHDLGKTSIPGHILNKPGKLSDDEFAIMRGHAALSGDIILKQQLRVDDIVIKIARHHHERIDGSGYPDRLQGQESIPYLVTLCGLSDVYDALTSDRVYHKARSLHEALKLIYSLRGTHFQSEWVDRFVQCVGVYPPSTIVQLTTGQTAVVMENNQEALQSPLVKIVADAAGVFYSRPVMLNLADEAAAKDIKIQKVVARDEAGFNAAYYFNAPKE